MNKYAFHVYVLPEDDADRQLADGFVNHHKVDDRRIQAMPLAGGWTNVLKTFKDEYIQTMKEYPQGQEFSLRIARRPVGLIQRRRHLH